MATNLLDESNIIEWHIDGWFKGSYCALSVLSLFLAIPGFFDSSSISNRINVSMVLSCVAAVIVRPTRMTYSESGCYSISLIYWLITFIFKGLLFAYYGTRIERHKRHFYIIGAIVTCLYISTLAGYSNECPLALLMLDSFSQWSYYAGGITTLFSIFSISVVSKEFVNQVNLHEDKRLERIQAISKVSLIISTVFIFIVSILSLTPYSDFRLLFLFGAIYAATASHLSMLLYQSLNLDTVVNLANNESDMSGVNASILTRSMPDVNK